MKLDGVWFHRVAAIVMVMVGVIPAVPGNVFGQSTAAVVPDRESSPILEVGWEELRNYVAAYVWIADIDFREGEIQGLHVCAGFNAFREPDQLAGFGFEEGSRPDPDLRAAAFALTMNSPVVMERASQHVRQIIKSPGYKNNAGQARLELARETLWKRVLSDPEIETAIKETVARLEDTTRRLTESGLLSGESGVSEPFSYMQGMNLLMIHADRLDAFLNDPAFTAIENQAAKRTFFKDEFTRLVAEAEIEDPTQREAYRTSLARDVERIFASGGSLVVRISE